MMLGPFTNNLPTWVGAPLTGVPPPLSSPMPSTGSRRYSIAGKNWPAEPGRALMGRFALKHGLHSVAPYPSRIRTPNFCIQTMLVAS